MSQTDRLAPRAVPVRCFPGDNLAIRVAVARAGSGSVLVVDVGDVSVRGYWGEVLTTGAEAGGLQGIMTECYVHDVEALEAHGFPVFSAGIALPGATKGASLAASGCRRRSEGFWCHWATG